MIKQVRVVYDYEKEYRVLVACHPDPEQLEAWCHGVVLEDGTRTAPAAVHQESVFGKGAWLRVILKEGRKRQICEMGEKTGLPVAKIIRVRIGTLKLGSLKIGEWRYLTADEVAALKGKPGKAMSRPSKTGYRQRKSGETSQPRHGIRKDKRR